MRLPLLVILAAFLLVAFGQSEPPAKGEAGPPAPQVPLVRPAPAPADRRSGSSQCHAIQRPAARVAKLMSKFSMPTRSIPEVRSAI
jgi:hypothetical protein